MAARLIKSKSGVTHTNLSLAFTRPHGLILRQDELEVYAVYAVYAISSLDTGSSLRHGTQNCVGLPLNTRTSTRHRGASRRSSTHGSQRAARTQPAHTCRGTHNSRRDETSRATRPPAGFGRLRARPPSLVAGSSPQQPPPPPSAGHCISGALNARHGAGALCRVRLRLRPARPDGDKGSGSRMPQCHRIQLPATHR